MAGGGTSNTVTKADPWSGQQPYLTAGFEDASNWYNSNNNSQYYQGNTVAGQSDATKNSYNMVQNAVTNNPLQNASKAQVQATLNGDYLNGNPYLDANFQTGANQIAKAYGSAIGQNASNAISSGRYGSGVQQAANTSAQDTMAKNLNDLYTKTYYNNYQNERQNQLNAVGQAQNVQNQALTNANALGSVGSAQDAYAQSLVDADVNKWNYNQNIGYNKLANYLSLINGNYGSSSTTSTPTQSNTMGNLLGTAAMGYGLLSGS